MRDASDNLITFGLVLEIDLDQVKTVKELLKQVPDLRIIYQVKSVGHLRIIPAEGI